MAKVDKTDHQRCKDHGCWMWTGCTIGNGYGGFAATNGKTRAAHRHSYIHFKGKIPEGMVIRHQCPYEEGDTDNRRCVNPDHLIVGTQRQNNNEGYSPWSMNAAKTCCPKCGGEYAVTKSGARRCKPCYNAYLREWKIKRKLEKQSANDASRPPAT
jgi:hypothetical protein